MVNQNAENEVYHDFKYWEDRSDEFRDGGWEGDEMKSGWIIRSNHGISKENITKMTKQTRNGEVDDLIDHLTGYLYSFVIQAFSL